MILLRAIPFAPILALSAGLVGEAGGRLKCGQFAGSALVAIDGVITAIKPDSVMKQLREDDLYSVEVVCMSPQDSTFQRGGSGIPVVSVWTKQGPIADVKTTLTSILAAQDAEFRRGSNYAKSLEAMDLPDVRKGVRVTLQTRERGWVAHATFNRWLGTCRIYDGVVEPRPVAEPRKISCD